MYMKRTLNVCSIALASTLLFSACGGSKSDSKKDKGDKGKKEKEDTTASKKDKSGKELTAEAFTKAVKKHVKNESEDGFFMLPHPDKKADTLKLKLQKPHKMLHKASKNEYFTCVEFKGKDGKSYDVDVYMKGKSADELTASKTMVHKIGGEKLFSYKKEDGMMKKKEMKSSKKEGSSKKDKKATRKAKDQSTPSRKGSS